MFTGSLSKVERFRCSLLIGATAFLGLAAASVANTPRRATLVPRTLPVKSIEASMAPGRDLGTLVIKLRDDSGARVENGRLALSSGVLTTKRLDTLAVGEVLSVSHSARVAPLFELPDELLDHLRRVGEQDTGRALADLTQFFVVTGHDVRAGEHMLGDLLSLDGVENAYAAPAYRTAADIGIVPTPDFVTQVPGQGYRGPAPAGIDVETAWSRGFRGNGITVADVEFNWNLDHEDLCHLTGQNPSVALVPPMNWADPVSPAVPPTSNQSHGTATVGVIASGDNGYGTSGIVPDATIHVVPAFRNDDSGWSPANAIVAAALALGRGDVLLIELQIGFLPFETSDAEFAAVRQVTALGIHVIEPAGNGNFDLDQVPVPLTGGASPFDPNVRDSGAVMVGASNPVDPDGTCTRWVSSNRGARLDTFSWGRNVTTLGYGPNSLLPCTVMAPAQPDAFPIATGSNEWYTHCYRGTSSAGAIVAGAAASLSRMHTAGYRGPFPTREMRNMLRLGTSCLGEGIGHQPDLRFYMNFLNRGGVIPHRFAAEARPVSTNVTQRFATAVDGAGDIDGDGLADLIVGIPGFSPQVQGITNSNTGRVIVYSGATGAVLWRFDGRAAGDRFGAAVAGGDDIDSDGVPDIVVGAPGVDAGGFTESGQVSAYSGETGLLLWTTDGLAAQGRFGFAVALPGDIDSSGSGNVFVGAPGDPFTGVGSAHLLEGSSGGVMLDIETPLPGARFGFSVAGAGDTDGDGELDLIVGAPNMVVGTFRAGAAIIYSGQGDELRILEGEPQPATFQPSHFGESVAGIGDIDDDGLDDVVVGAPSFTNTFAQGQFGRAYVYSAADTPLDIFTGQQQDDRFGATVAGIGDFNGDTVPDIAIGQPSTIATQTGIGNVRPGRVFVRMGPFPQQASLPLGQRRRMFWTRDETSFFGAAVAGAGDVNGDGRADIIVGEPGADDVNGDFFPDGGNIDGQAWVFARNSAVGRGVPRLVADYGAIEATDTNGSGNGGGGASPESSRIVIDAPAWAGANFRIVGFVRPPFDVNPAALALVDPTDSTSALINRIGTLDANGRATLPRFGPISYAILSGLEGAEFGFIALLQGDIDNDGDLDAGRTNTAIVTIIDE